MSLSTYRLPMYFCLYPFPLIESTCVTWSVMGLKGNFMTNLPATTEVKANNFICIWVSNNCRIIYLETTITQIYLLRPFTYYTTYKYTYVVIRTKCKVAFLLILLFEGKKRKLFSSEWKKLLVVLLNKRFGFSSSLEKIPLALQCSKLFLDHLPIP